MIAIDHLDYFFNSQYASTLRPQSSARPNPLPQCTKTIALLTETILHEEREYDSFDFDSICLEIATKFMD